MPMTLRPEPFAYALLARQPLFDKCRNVRGYELLFRNAPGDDTAEIGDLTVATMRVVADASVCLGPWLKSECLAMINFSRTAILQGVPYALPPAFAAVEIEQREGADPPLLSALAKLKADGYRISLDLDPLHPPADALVALADFAKIDVLSTPPEALAAAVRRLSGTRARLLAKRVETKALYDLAESLGFSWFQGFFFQRPEIVPGRKLPSNQATRLRLFRLIEQEDMDLSRLVESIESDVSISYRLLSLINSAAFGLPQKVNSIERAIVMLGWRQLKNWLRVVIFTDLAPKGKTKELSISSVLRGKFLETVAAVHRLPGPDPDLLFLLGLFSLLEPLLGIPMPEVLANLPLDEEIKAALCGEAVPLARWLTLARCFESADWDGLDAVLREFGLDPGRVAKSYVEALEWTNSFFVHTV